MNSRFMHVSVMFLSCVDDVTPVFTCIGSFDCCGVGSAMASISGEQPIYSTTKPARQTDKTVNYTAAHGYSTTDRITQAAGFDDIVAIPTASVSRAGNCSLLVACYAPT